MAADVIVDTGAILALLDENDRWHALCSDALRQLRLPLLTSEAVLTEVFHLIRRSRTEMEAVWTLVHSGVIVLATIDNSELHRIQALMSRYKDLPMDFADATLVHLGEREAITAVFTLDQNDFATYRINGVRRFHILPVERP
jgi:predicted nucleic acid-binding protein